MLEFYDKYIQHAKSTQFANISPSQQPKYFFQTTRDQIAILDVIFDVRCQSIGNRLFYNLFRTFLFLQGKSAFLFLHSCLPS